MGCENNKVITECICGDSSHIIKFGFLDFWPLELFVEVQMNPDYPWYKRLWNGIKYIFGISTTGDHWHCGCISPKYIDQVMKLFSEYKIYFEVYEKNGHKDLSEEQILEIKNRDKALTNK